MNEVIHLRLRRRPPAAGAAGAAATGSAATGSATGTAGLFEEKNDPNNPDEGGACDCGCDLPEIRGG